MTYYSYTNTIYHHGIKGQEWGVKNGPPYPLDPEDHSASEKRAKKSTRTTKSQLKTKLTKEEIERRKKMKKLAIGIAGVAGIGAASYLVYKSGFINSLSKHDGLITNQAIDEALQRAKQDKDFILPEGTTIRRVTTQENWDLKDARDSLYTTFDEKDSAVYRQLLRLRDKHGKDLPVGSKVFEVSMKTQKDLKIPSKATAEEIFNKLLDNDEYRSNMLISMYGRDGASAEYVKKHKLITFDDAVYKLVKDEKSSQTFRKAITDAGYSGIVDYFDKGTMSQAPIILFDKSGLTKVGERRVRQVLGVGGLKTIRDAKMIKGIGIDSIENMAQEIEIGTKVVNASLAAVPVGAAIGIASNKASKKKAIEKYRKEHPNSKLSDAEIIKMYK